MKMNMDVLTDDEKKVFKRILRNVYKQRPLPEQKPLFHAERVQADGDEGVVEYGFITLHGEKWTDDEINEELRTMERHNLTPYDCSGQLCTTSIRFHRNPCGAVSFVHYLTLDI